MVHLSQSKTLCKATLMHWLIFCALEACHGGKVLVMDLRAWLFSNWSRTVLARSCNLQLISETRRN